MTWEHILKGETIRKDSVWDMEWQVATDSHWENSPDGYDDVDGKVIITKTEGSVDIDVRTRGINQRGVVCIAHTLVLNLEFYMRMENNPKIWLRIILKLKSLTMWGYGKKVTLTRI